MNLRVAIVSVCLCFFFGLPTAHSQSDSTEETLAAAGYVRDRDYIRLPDSASGRSASADTEVAEFFMHSCIHCYNAEPRVEGWLASISEGVDFVRVTVVSNPVVERHARAYYAAGVLGVQQQVHSAMFREIHVNRNYLQSADALADFFAQFDVQREDFDSAFESFGVTAQVSRANDLVRRYGVDQTPTFVVNGRYRLTRSMSGGDDRLFDMIDLMIEADR